LPADQQSILVNCLRANPGQVTIAALENDGEAYRYAQGWQNMFKGAQWNTENDQHIPIETFAIGGGMWSGVQLKIHGTIDGTGRVRLDNGSPEETLVGCLKMTHGIGVAVIPYGDISTGHAELFVSDLPKQP
jgi:hypothetical protein